MDGIATLLACLLPAARAIRINPTKALNEQPGSKAYSRFGAASRFLFPPTCG